MERSAEADTPLSNAPLSSRQKILDLAVAALELGGPASLRVNEIAREAGVAVTSLYHFFGNREGLLSAAQIASYRRATTQEFAAAEAALARCTSRSEFRALLEASILHFLRSPENIANRRVRLQTYAAALSRPDIATLLAEDQELQGERMFAFLEPLKAKGWVKPDVDTRTFGSFYLGVMLGHTQYEVGRPHLDIEAWNQFTLNALLQFIPEGD